MRKIKYILYQPYKWLIFVPLVLLVTIISIIGVVVLCLFSSKIANKCGVFWATIIKILVPMRIKMYGKEHIDKKQSYIIVANHQSGFDIIVLYSNLGVDFKWIMKKELRKVPLLGFGCERLQHIFIDRSSARAAYRSIQEAKKKLVNGTSVIIFPEGTRSYSNVLSPFKHGAFKMALDLDLPILPISIKDTHKIMGRSIHSLLPGKVEITIHEPIEINKFDREHRDELIELTRNTIQNALK